MQGTIFLATNVAELNYIQAIRNQTGKTNKCKIIVADDMYDKRDPNVICASILLPSVSSMTKLIDNCGDQTAVQVFQMEYEYKLTNDRDVIEYLAVLIAGVLQYGYDYIFYIDSSNDPTMMLTLYGVLCSRYGFLIVTYPMLCANIGTVNCGGIDPRFINNAMSLIHSFGYADPNNDQSGKLFMNLS